MVIDLKGKHYCARNSPQSAHAASDVTMSSSGSVSSRLRQLGLYRSIDARTEEFLRLSRRRQIKQGCVCAAVSTAVTVTVVICVILVYEYIIISERSRQVQSWRNLMNSSAGTLPFRAELNDIINIDLAAPKLLPRLIKTLSQNRFINEIIGDTPNDIEYRKKIFLDVRNWIVLLICEYMIVVETNTVQNMKKVNVGKRTHDSPVADKLDRSDFGFDQDYFERMPLLLNALQDNSYIDPTAEMPAITRKGPHLRHHNYRATAYPPRKTIRKSSPQPFLFEYRSPYPRPFRKEATSTSNSWSESYHNAQRLKNLNDVVKYLEKTLNAKFGELYIPSESQVAFSNLFVAPTNGQRHNNPKHQEKGNKFEEYWNHHIDPLFSFKPENPSDVNFLVDDTKLYFISRKKSLPRLRYSAKKCLRRNCETYEPNQRDSQVFNFEGIQNHRHENTDSLKGYENLDNQKNIDPNKITITTNRPLFQFRRKTYKPKGRHTFSDNRQTKEGQESQINIQKERPGIPQLILRLNLYSLKDTDSSKLTSTTPQPVYSSEPITTPLIKHYVTDNVNQFELDATSVEDFHIGSSGVIPITQPTSPSTYPITTPIVPHIIPDLNIGEQITTVPTTSPPEIFKFNPEDAKVPDQYLNLRTTEQPFMYTTDFRYLYEDRNQKDNINSYQHNNNIRKSDVTITTYNYDNGKESKEDEDKNEDDNLETLIVKLKNSISSTTQEYKDEDDPENVTETYVPQLNGHYRNIKYKNLSTLLKESSERYRKRLANLTIMKRPYVPMLRDGKNNATDLFRI
ncbi:uncharacterized protein LOC121731242 [Aricia agestis]|uniref:uncharacterized protein LOC121731242 n=1 Tax=Aricia agestis TaxID=91739 RepID=UPI001C206D89|nr:uncharacterized protein LOC121731242 [Aricia agestis]